MKIITTLLLPLLTLSCFANDGTMYCYNQWLSVGESAQFVYKLCGKPSHMKHHTVKSFTRYGAKLIESDTHYQQWIYNRGSDTFIEYLTFREGELIDIQDGDYGTD
ncbi:MAG: DUF2845 domain-containing protein [Coxiellaceae bacterium]|nr:DUF2845 domain-containing protein [Coxiellaceae bacterium]